MFLVRIHPAVVIGLCGTVLSGGFRAAPSQAQIDTRSNAHPLESRRWTDITGKYSIEGTLKRVQNEAVTLQLKDGSTVSVAIQRLSAADQEYIKQRVGSDGAAQAKGPGSPKRLLLEKSLPPGMEIDLRVQAEDKVAGRLVNKSDRQLTIFCPRIVGRKVLTTVSPRSEATIETCVVESGFLWSGEAAALYGKEAIPVLVTAQHAPGVTPYALHFVLDRDSGEARLAFSQELTLEKLTACEPSSPTEMPKPERQFRRWSDGTGKHITEAALLMGDWWQDKVVFERSDGSLFQVPRDRLSGVWAVLESRDGSIQYVPYKGLSVSDSEYVSRRNRERAVARDGMLQERILWLKLLACCRDDRAIEVLHKAFSDNFLLIDSQHYSRGGGDAPDPEGPTRRKLRVAAQSAIGQLTDVWYQITSITHSNGKTITDTPPKVIAKWRDDFMRLKRVALRFGWERIDGEWRMTRAAGLRPATREAEWNAYPLAITSIRYEVAAEKSVREAPTVLSLTYDVQEGGASAGGYASLVILFAFTESVRSKPSVLFPTITDPNSRALLVRKHLKYFGGLTTGQSYAAIASPLTESNALGKGPVVETSDPAEFGSQKRYRLLSAWVSFRPQ